MRFCVSLFALCLSIACSKTESAKLASSSSAPSSAAERPPEPPPVKAEVLAVATPSAASDPHGGTFTLDEATALLSSKGNLVAVIETTLGTFTCELFEKEVPNTVANFVGLARGLRAFKDTKTGAWTKRPYYDGIVFHRVIPNFMIQGGDPTGTGRGDPGYVIADEFAPSLTHDKPGMLSMANKGPNTGGGQFFITEKATPWLDGRHAIFGHCTPEALVATITHVPTGPMNRPVEPVVMNKVTILRK